MSEAKREGEREGRVEKKRGKEVKRVVGGGELLVWVVGKAAREREEGLKKKKKGGKREEEGMELLVWVVVKKGGKGRRRGPGVRRREGFEQKRVEEEGRERSKVRGKERKREGVCYESWRRRGREGLVRSGT